MLLLLAGWTEHCILDQTISRFLIQSVLIFFRPTFHIINKSHDILGSGVHIAESIINFVGMEFCTLQDDF